LKIGTLVNPTPENVHNFTPILVFECGTDGQTGTTGIAAYWDDRTMRYALMRKLKSLNNLPQNAVIPDYTKNRERQGSGNTQRAKTRLLLSDAFEFSSCQAVSTRTQ